MTSCLWRLAMAAMVDTCCWAAAPSSNSTEGARIREKVREEDILGEGSERRTREGETDA